MYGEDPEILYRGVFGYSDVVVSSLTGRVEGGRDSRGRAVCVIEDHGQGRMPTLAIDEIERERATGNHHDDNDAYLLRNITHVQSIPMAETPRIEVRIPEDISAFAQTTAERVVNRIYTNRTNENSQGNTQAYFD